MAKNRRENWERKSWEPPGKTHLHFYKKKKHVCSSVETHTAEAARCLREAFRQVARGAGLSPCMGLSWGDLRHPKRASFTPAGIGCPTVPLASACPGAQPRSEGAGTRARGAAHLPRSQAPRGAPRSGQIRAGGCVPRGRARGGDHPCQAHPGGNSPRFWQERAPQLQRQMLSLWLW